ncbi:MAG: ABC transporter permease [Lachnospiraceae bacterium]|nr:ABC transporter permease [Lachnospiraceae bacterium]
MNFKFLVKKIITSLVTLFLLATVTFFIFEIIPGNVVLTKLGTEATKESIEAMEKLYGLDKSLADRYIQFILGLFTGDFGISYSTNLPVSSMINNCLPVTINLAIISLVLVVVVSVPLGLFFGLISSKKKNAKKVFAIDVTNQTFMSIPPFVIGIVISLFFGLTLKWFVPGYVADINTDFTGFLWCLVPAAVSVAIPKIAMMIRFIRTSVADEMEKNYVRLARSKGMSEVRVLFLHVLKNVLITNVTALSVVVVEIFAGSVVIEQVFSLNGMGRLLIASISGRDYKVVSAIVMYVGIVVILTNLLVDILYAIVDKRTVSADE